MFDKENLPVRFANLQHRQMTKDDQEIPLVEIQLEIDPFTKDLAKELDDFVRRMLFTATDAEVTSKLKGAAFNLAIRPQAIAIRMAPDQKDASFVIDEAKIGVLHAKRSKKSPTWRLVFTATCAPPSEHQLAQIVDSYLKMRYATFANAVAGLFDEEEKQERKARRTAPAAGDNATAH